MRVGLTSHTSANAKSASAAYLTHPSADSVRLSYFAIRRVYKGGGFQLRGYNGV